MTEEERKPFEVDLMKREMIYDQFTTELFEDKKIAAELKAKAQNPAITPVILKYPSRNLFAAVTKKMAKDPVSMRTNLQALIKQRKEYLASVALKYTYKQKGDPSFEGPKPETAQ